MAQKYLRRFTDIPSLVYILSERKITLLDPQSWDDKNDSHYLSAYKKRKGLKTVLALCFSQAAETYHHWKVFADTPSGVCIRFRRTELLDYIKRKDGIRSASVEYLTLKAIQKRDPATPQLPFIKRRAFKDEAEFRIVYESKNRLKRKFEIQIPISCIDRITLSPWLHNSLAKPVKNLIGSIDGCCRLNVVRSTLVDNKKWKTLAGPPNS